MQGPSTINGMTEMEWLEREQEKEMIELAMERSLQDQQQSPSQPATQMRGPLHTGAHNGYDQQGRSPVSPHSMNRSNAIPIRQSYSGQQQQQQQQQQPPYRQDNDRNRIAQRHSTSYNNNRQEIYRGNNAYQSPMANREIVGPRDNSIRNSANNSPLPRPNINNPRTPIGYNRGGSFREVQEVTETVIESPHHTFDRSAPSTPVFRHGQGNPPSIDRPLQHRYSYDGGAPAASPYSDRISPANDFGRSLPNYPDHNDRAIVRPDLDTPRIDARNAVLATARRHLSEDEVERVEQALSLAKSTHHSRSSYNSSNHSGQRQPHLHAQETMDLLHRASASDHLSPEELGGIERALHSNDTRPNSHLYPQQHQLSPHDIRQPSSHSDESPLLVPIHEQQHMQVTSHSEPLHPPPREQTYPPQQHRQPYHHQMVDPRGPPPSQHPQSLPLQLYRPQPQPQPPPPPPPTPTPPPGYRPNPRFAAPARTNSGESLALARAEIQRAAAANNLSKEEYDQLMMALEDNNKNSNNDGGDNSRTPPNQSASYNSRLDRDIRSNALPQVNNTGQLPKRATSYDSAVNDYTTSDPRNGFGGPPQSRNMQRPERSSSYISATCEGQGLDNPPQRTMQRPRRTSSHDNTTYDNFVSNEESDRPSRISNKQLPKRSVSYDSASQDSRQRRIDQVPSLPRRQGSRYDQQRPAAEVAETPRQNNRSCELPPSHQGPQALGAKGVVEGVVRSGTGPSIPAGEKSPAEAPLYRNETEAPGSTPLPVAVPIRRAHEGDTSHSSYPGDGHVTPLAAKLVKQIEPDYDNGAHTRTNDFHAPTHFDEPQTDRLRTEPLSRDPRSDLHGREPQAHNLPRNMHHQEPQGSRDYNARQDGNEEWRARGHFENRNQNQDIGYFEEQNQRQRWEEQHRRQLHNRMREMHGSGPDHAAYWNPSAEVGRGGPNQFEQQRWQQQQQQHHQHNHRSEEGAVPSVPQQVEAKPPNRREAWAADGRQDSVSSLGESTQYSLLSAQFRQGDYERYRNEDHERALHERNNGRQLHPTPLPHSMPEDDACRHFGPSPTEYGASHMQQQHPLSTRDHDIQLSNDYREDRGRPVQTDQIADHDRFDEDLKRALLESMQMQRQVVDGEDEFNQDMLGRIDPRDTRLTEDQLDHINRALSGSAQLVGGEAVHPNFNDDDQNQHESDRHRMVQDDRAGPMSRGWPDPSRDRIASPTETTDQTDRPERASALGTRGEQQEAATNENVLLELALQQAKDEEERQSLVLAYQLQQEEERRASVTREMERAPRTPNNGALQGELPRQSGASSGQMPEVPFSSTPPRRPSQVGASRSSRRERARHHLEAFFSAPPQERARRAGAIRSSGPVARHPLEDSYSSLNQNRPSNVGAIRSSSPARARHPLEGSSSSPAQGRSASQRGTVRLSSPERPQHPLEESGSPQSRSNSPRVPPRHASRSYQDSYSSENSSMHSQDDVEPVATPPPHDRRSEFSGGLLARQPSLRLNDLEETLEHSPTATQPQGEKKPRAARRDSSNMLGSVARIGKKSVTTLMHSSMKLGSSIRKGLGASQNLTSGSHAGNIDTKATEMVYETRIQIDRAVNAGIISFLSGAVRFGNEATIYHAEKGPESHGFDVAVKVYKRAEGGGSDYGDRSQRDLSQFQNISTKEQLRLWTLKEFRNLTKARKFGVSSPAPIYTKNNILFMQFMGVNGQPSPQLGEMELRRGHKRWKALYEQIVEAVRRLYTSAKLVHGNLNDSNILVVPRYLVDVTVPSDSKEYEADTAVLIDFGRTVDSKHPDAMHLLRCDLTNMKQFFAKQGIRTPSVDDALKSVTAGWDSTNAEWRRIR